MLLSVNGAEKQEKSTNLLAIPSIVLSVLTLPWQPFLRLGKTFSRLLGMFVFQLSYFFLKMILKAPYFWSIYLRFWAMIRSRHGTDICMLLRCLQPHSSNLFFCTRSAEQASVLIIGSIYFSFFDVLGAQIN
jgi:hypothetical protein